MHIFSKFSWGWTVPLGMVLIRFSGRHLAFISPVSIELLCFFPYHRGIFMCFRHPVAIALLHVSIYSTSTFHLAKRTIRAWTWLGTSGRALNEFWPQNLYPTLSKRWHIMPQSPVAYSLRHNTCYLAFISAHEWSECRVCLQLCSFFSTCLTLAHRSRVQ